MSRKNYRAVASLIAAEYTQAPSWRERCAIRVMAQGLARIFSDDNPRFSVQRFYEACECGLSDAEKSEARHHA